MLWLVISLEISSSISKQIVDICLGDACSFSWWMARFMLLVPLIGTSELCLSMSKVIHDPSIFKSQPSVLFKLICCQILQHFDFFCDRTSIVNPVL